MASANLNQCINRAGIFSTAVSASHASKQYVQGRIDIQASNGQRLVRGETEDTIMCIFIIICLRLQNRKMGVWPFTSHVLSYSGFSRPYARASSTFSFRLSGAQDFSFSLLPATPSGVFCSSQT